MAETFKLKDGSFLVIDLDNEPESPREWENMGKMVLSHKRYNLPNEVDINFKAFDSWAEIKHHLITELKAVVILGVYMYEHSGTTIRTKPFNDYFDSGQIGFIFATEEDIKKEFSEVTEMTKEQTAIILENEVKLYDEYLGGEVYEYSAYTLKTCECCGHTEKEFKDSCGGFFGQEGYKQILEDEFKGLEPEEVTK